MQEKANTIIQAILIISSIFILVASFLIAYLLYFNKRKTRLIAEKDSLKVEFQHQLLQSQVEVQESTYSTLSKELHDNVGQLLSSAKMLLGLTERNLENPPATLLIANETISKAISEIRLLSKSLDKEWLEQFSFTENLNAEILRINAGNKVFAEFTCTHQIELKADEQIILFRIVQEAIQNAIKHAQPKHILVVIKSQEDKLDINVVDNGKGFIMTKAISGMGLSNMKHRVALLGGNISWNSVPGTGTTVRILLPFKEV